MKKHYLFSVFLVFSTFLLFGQVPKLVGINPYGGFYKTGTVYAVDTNGTNYQDLDSFPIIPDGKVTNTYSQLVETGGIIYGTVRDGGNFDRGVLFSYNPTSKVYSVKAHFKDSIGAYPGAIVVGSNGKIYGVTAQGGSLNRGVIFEFDPTTQITRRLTNFSYSITGSEPIGKLLELTPGVFYGTCRSGGSNGDGTVFSFSTSTNILTKKDDFHRTKFGAYPTRGFVKASNNKLYTSNYFGSGSLSTGAIVEYDLVADSLKLVHILPFSNPSSSFYSKLTEVSPGVLAGSNATASSSNNGILFEYSISGDSILKIDSFSTGLGRYPYGKLTPSTSGKFLQVCSFGGLQFSGVIMEYDPSTKALTQKKQLFPVPNLTGPRNALLKSPTTGKYYGISSGGSSGFGTIYEYDMTLDSIIVVHDFSECIDGYLPVNKFLKASNGKLYGITSRGSENNKGALIEFDPVTLSTTKKVNLSVLDSSNFLLNTKGNLIEATNGNLYGVSTNGGVNNSGIIFEYNISTGILSKLIDLIPAIGTQPSGLVQANNGKLYGLVNVASSAIRGRVFEFDILTNSLTPKADFTSINPSVFTDAMIKTSSGRLLGVARNGGTFNKGGIFEYLVSSDSLVFHDNFNDTLTGSFPRGALMEASNGKLYGMTRSGATNSSASSRGVVYEFDPLTNTLKGKANFTTAIGVGGDGSLIQSSNGKLYGVSGSRTIFEYSLGSDTVLFKSRFVGRSSLSFNSLVEVNLNLGSTSIDEKDKHIHELIVYPNPASDILTVDIKDEKIIDIRILSATGALVSIDNSKTNQLSVGHLPSGLYIIQVRTESGVALSRFIKK